jgi:hypothetical protein
MKQKEERRKREQESEIDRGDVVLACVYICVCVVYFVTVP